MQLTHHIDANFRCWVCHFWQQASRESVHPKLVKQAQAALSTLGSVAWDEVVASHPVLHQLDDRQPHSSAPSHMWAARLATAMQQAPAELDVRVCQALLQYSAGGARLHVPISHAAVLNRIIAALTQLPDVHVVCISISDYAARPHKEQAAELLACDDRQWVQTAGLTAALQRLFVSMQHHAAAPQLHLDVDVQQWCKLKQIEVSALQYSNAHIHTLCWRSYWSEDACDDEFCNLHAALSTFAGSLRSIALLSPRRSMDFGILHLGLSQLQSLSIHVLRPLGDELVLQQADLATLTQAFQAMQALAILSLHGITIDEGLQHSDELQGMLANRHSLKHVEICNSHWPRPADSASSSVCPLPHMPAGLVRLSMRNCQLHGIDLKSIFTLLKLSGCCIQDLDLGGNEIGVGGAGMLSCCMVRSADTLRHLRLDKCRLGAEGAALVAEALRFGNEGQCSCSESLPQAASVVIYLHATADAAAVAHLKSQGIQVRVHTA